MKTRILSALGAVLLVSSLSWAISTVTIPFTFSNNTKAESAQVNSNFTALETGVNAAIGAINTAAGTKSSLDARLDVAINADGTFRNISGVTASSQWTTPAITQRYSSANRFIIEGSDQRDIYITYRRLKLLLSASTEYSEVVSSAYTGGNTIVTIADAVLTDPITNVQHSIFSPAGSTDSAVSSKSMTGYATATASTANTLVVRNAFGNISAAQVTGTHRGGIFPNISSSTTANGSAPYTRYEQGLRIIRGKVNTATGARVSGSGFASSGTLDTIISFNKAFTAAPSISVAHEDNAFSSCGIYSVAANTFTVVCWDASSAPPTKAGKIVHFIAIGPNQ